MPLKQLTCLWLLTYVSLANGHRSLPSGVTCGQQFASPSTALAIPNAAISWANYGIYTCEHPIQWFEAYADENQALKFTITIPVIDRFEGVRMNAVFLGPGLPPLDALDDSIPESIREYAADNDLGGAVFASPDDQSTCDHLTSPEMISEVTVKDERCHFYEPFGGSNLWVIMDDILTVPEAGTFKIAVYEESGSTAKASFACCDWPEDFVTQYQMPSTECEACGTDPSNPAWSSLFFEQKSMESFGGYPPLQNCAVDPTPIELPEGDECPEDAPFGAAGSDVQQPESCALGCDSTGECHSHNVFGECTHVLDWTLSPKFGEAEVGEVIIFKGDKIRFVHSSDDGLAHDLYKMAGENSLETCDFGGSDRLAGVGEVSIGHDVSFDEAGVYRFACSIGCNVAALAPEQQDNSFCHCAIGQTLTVQVKDSTDGLRCHDHAQERHDHAADSFAPPASSPLVCPEGTENARATNNPAYQAMNENECSEQCASAIAVSFMPGVELGSCIDLGFVSNPQTYTVRPDGSPGDIEVRVTSNADAETMVADDEEERESTCHCHSYEEIVCPEYETEADTLYEEHIEEINEFCQGILDGTEQDCPYKCFQPMEVLHLHYLECSSRPIDPMYVSVNDTNKCHIAAAAPEGVSADECPAVDLTSLSTAKPAPSDTVEKEDSSLPTGFVIGISLAGTIVGLSVMCGLVALCFFKCRKPANQYEGGEKDGEKDVSSSEGSTAHFGESSELP